MALRIGRVTQKTPLEKRKEYLWEEVQKDAFLRTYFTTDHPLFEYELIDLTGCLHFLIRFKPTGHQISCNAFVLDLYHTLTPKAEEERFAESFMSALKFLLVNDICGELAEEREAITVYSKEKGFDWDEAFAYLERLAVFFPSLTFVHHEGEKYFRFGVQGADGIDIEQTMVALKKSEFEDFYKRSQVNSFALNLMAKQMLDAQFCRVMLSCKTKAQMEQAKADSKLKSDTQKTLNDLRAHLALDHGPHMVNNLRDRMEREQNEMRVKV